MAVSFTNLTLGGAVVTSFRSPGRAHYIPEFPRKGPLKEEVAYVRMKMKQGDRLFVQRNNDFEVYRVWLGGSLATLSDRVSTDVYHELIRKRRIITQYCYGNSASYVLTGWWQREVLLFKKWIR